MAVLTKTTKGSHLIPTEADINYSIIDNISTLNKQLNN